MMKMVHQQNLHVGRIVNNSELLSLVFILYVGPVCQSLHILTLFLLQATIAHEFCTKFHGSLKFRNFMIFCNEMIIYISITAFRVNMKHELFQNLFYSGDTALVAYFLFQNYPLDANYV